MSGIIPVQLNLKVHETQALVLHQAERECTGIAGKRSSALHTWVRDGLGLTVVTDEDVVGRVATVGFPTIYQGAATLRTSRTNRFTYTVAGMSDHVDTADSSGTLRTTYYKYDDARLRRQADSPEGVLICEKTGNDRVGSV